MTERSGANRSASVKSLSPETRWTERQRGAHLQTYVIRGWTESLARPGYESLDESMVAELAEYLGESTATVAWLCESGAEIVAQEWKARQLGKESSRREVEEFYRTTGNYLFDLTAFNSEYPHVDALEALVKMARDRELKETLDFGAGIGSVGVFFAKNGLNVSLADISEPLQKYASWRFQIRGLKPRLIDLKREELPKNVFEIVTAFDVLEHLSDPAETLRGIAASMKVGGVFACNVDDPGDSYPQHISTYEEVLSSAPMAGFRRINVLGSVQVFERVQRGLFSTFWHTLWIRVWYRGFHRKYSLLRKALRIKM